MNDEEGLVVACCLVPALSGVGPLAKGESYAHIEAMVTGPMRFAKYESYIQTRSSV